MSARTVSERGEEIKVDQRVDQKVDQKDKESTTEKDATHKTETTQKATQKEKVTRIASRHPREDFPPHPDDPSCARSACIVSNFGAVAQGVFAKKEAGLGGGRFL